MGDQDEKRESSTEIGNEEHWNEDNLQCQEQILKEIIFKRTFWILDIPLTIDLCL